MSFSDFNLKEEFISSIKAAGYESPTPLQSQLIPLVANKKSAIVWTQSASGKTGAFLIPAINYILENPAPEKRGARVLILTSRRDRVSQINYTIKRLSNDHTMRFGFIVSGRPYQTQMRLMRRPLDIMIATPGRLNDLMNNGKADFSQLEMLIIDDLTSIYQKNLHGLIEKIVEQAGENCSNIVFVRDDEEITSYTKKLFPNAVEITVNDDSNETDSQPNQETNVNNKKSNTEKTIKTPHQQTVDINALMPQKVHIADDYTHKIAMMDHLMDEFAGESTLIYVATNKAAKTLLDNLANHGHAAELNQELSPENRNECDIIIVSDQEKETLSNHDVAGNDTHIIHFDLPRRTDKYLERLQKHDQNREEATLLMVDGYNYNELKHIEKTMGTKLEQVNVPGLEPLKPFINQSKSRPKNQSRQPAKQHQTSPRNKKTRFNKKGQNKKTRNPNQQKTSGNANGNNNAAPNNDNDQQRRQRKGPFGRLNGGANRKNSGSRNRSSGPKFGVSSRGTSAPKTERGWQSDFAEPKERKSESKNVVIRYSKKRSLLDKNDDV